MGPLYATREAVKAALDYTAPADARIDEAIEAASRAIEGDLHRRFYPELATRNLAWPGAQYARSWRVWLDDNELISLTTLVSGGVTIPEADYYLEPQSSGPPYTSLEIDLSSSSAFSAGGTHQRSLALTGLFGYRNAEDPAGTLAAAVVSASATTITVTDSAIIGVGQLIRVGTERMQVTDKTMVTTGQTLQTPLTASQAGTSVAVTTGSAYAVGETLLLDSERMLIVDIAGNTLTVKRAHDGSVLAAHTGSTIYAPRTLTVERGALGTTPATHLISAAVVKHRPPALIRQLAVAEALDMLLQESGGYAGTTGAGAGRRYMGSDALVSLRERAYATHGRKARMRAI